MKSQFESQTPQNGSVKNYGKTPKKFHYVFMKLNWILQSKTLLNLMKI